MATPQVLWGYEKVTDPSTTKTFAPRSARFVACFSWDSSRVLAVCRDSMKAASKHLLRVSCGMIRRSRSSMGVWGREHFLMSQCLARCCQKPYAKIQYLSPASKHLAKRRRALIQVNELSIAQQAQGVRLKWYQKKTTHSTDGITSPLLVPEDQPQPRGPQWGAMRHSPWENVQLVCASLCLPASQFKHHPSNQRIWKSQLGGLPKPGFCSNWVGGPRCLPENRNTAQQVQRV